MGGSQGNFHVHPNYNTCVVVGTLVTRQEMHQRQSLKCYCRDSSKHCSYTIHCGIYFYPHNESNICFKELYLDKIFDPEK